MMEEDPMLSSGQEHKGAHPAGTILPYPFEGKFYSNYEDQSAPILRGQFHGDKDITLTLPDTLKATDIKWLSVWCRRFTVDFGSLIFPDDLVLDQSHAPEPIKPEEEPKTEPEPETNYEHPQKPEELPPPVLSPVDNDISNAHNHHRHDQDADAYPESEPESETEPEPYSGASLISCTNIMAMVVAIISGLVL